MMKEYLSIVMIAHNEEKTVGKTIDGLISHYRNKILELIVVDDASTDGTAAIVESERAKEPKVKLVKREPPCGVGHAIKTGFKNVDPRASFVLTMDSDFVENIEDVGSLITRVEAGDCDGAIGSRFIKGSYITGYPFTKMLMNRLFHHLVRLLFRIKQKDLTNNFKIFKREIIEKMPWNSDGFSINAETGILPILYGYNICEVPVSWIGRKEDQGKSKFRLFQVGMGYVEVIPYVFSLRRRILLLAAVFFILTTGAAALCEEAGEGAKKEQPTAPTAQEMQRSFEDAMRRVNREKADEEKAEADKIKAIFNKYADRWISEAKDKESAGLNNFIKQEWQKLATIKYFVRFDPKFDEPNPFIHYDYYLRDFEFIERARDVTKADALMSPYKGHLELTEKRYVERYHTSDISYPESFLFTVTTPISVNFEYMDNAFILVNVRTDTDSLERGWPQSVRTKLRIKP